MATAAQLSVPHGPLIHLASGSGVTDQSAYQRSGISYEGGMGVSGGAYLFDGVDDYIDLDTFAAVLSDLSPTSFSGSIWIKTGSDASNRVIWFTTHNNIRQGVYVRLDSTGHIRTFFGTNQVSWAGTLSTGTVDDDQWHHIVVTWEDGVGGKCYIDGVLDGTDSDTDTLTWTTVTKGALGKDTRTSQTSIFDGYADGLDIYAYTLTAAEILTLYNADRQPNYTHPKFDRPRNIPGTVFALRGETGAIDQSDYNQTGIEFEGDAYADETGLHFDGTGDYLSVADTNTLDIGASGRFTFSARVRLDGTGTQGIWHKINQSYSADGISFHYNSGINALRLSASSGGGTQFSVWDGATDIADEEWHHVACVIKERRASPVLADVAFYVDGIEESLTLSTNNADLSADLSNNEPAAIGARQAGATFQDFFDGTIDDIRIINRALSAGEIANLAAGGSGDGLPPDDTDLVLKLDPADYSGTGNLLDGSGESNDATFNGNAAVEGGVLVLDGTGDYLEVEDSNSIDMVDDFCWSCWLRIDSDWHGTIVDKGTWSLAQVSGNIRFTVDGVNVTWSRSSDELEWTHLLVQRDGTRRSIFADGVEVAWSTSGSTASDLSDATDLTIGTDLTGAVTKCRLYSESLTATQIRDLYYEDRPLYQPVGLLGGEVAAWRPDRWIGHGDLLDESGNAEDITLTDTFTMRNGSLTIEGEGVDTTASLASSSGSIAAWVKISDDRGILFGGNSPGFCGYYQDGSTSNSYSDITGRITYVDGVAIAGTRQALYDALTGGEWKHLAITGTFGTSWSKVGIGMYTSPHNSLWTAECELDDPRIFDRILDPAEIKALASSRPFDTPNTLGSSLFISPSTQHAWGSGEDVAVDLSGSANNGTLTNMDAATDWVTDTDSDGVAALDFDGTVSKDDEIIVATSSTTFSLPTLGNRVAVSAWVYNRSFPTYSGINSQEIWQHGPNNTTNGEWYLVQVNNKWRFQIWQGSPYRAESTTTIAADTWYHVAGVWDGAEIKLYVNGVLEDTAAAAISPADLSATTRIGRLGATSYEYSLDGYLDLIPLHTRPLTDEQIALWAQSRSPFADPVVSAVLSYSGRRRRKMAGGIQL